MTDVEDSTAAGHRGPFVAPKTRIGWTFTALNVLSLFFVGVTAVLGFFVESDGLFWFHLTSGLGTAVLGLFGLVSAMFYLVVSGMGIRETVMVNKLPIDLFARTRQFKKELFPWCVATIILLITMTVLGGGVHVKKIHKYYHLAFAVVTIVVYLGAIRSMRSCYARNGLLIAEVLDALEQKDSSH
jgi:hypothetical protein